MNQNEKRAVELLSSNYNAITKEFKLRGPVEITLASLVWTLAERQTDGKQMRACYKHLKRATSSFSAARYKNVLALASRMAMSEDGEAYLAEVLRINNKIMEGKKVETTARFGTALAIANDTKTPEEADRLLERTQRIFEGMKESHPLITDERSMPFAAIIALTESDEEKLLANAEECYKLLGKEYKLLGGRLTMAHVLAISPLPAERKVKRVEDLRAAFKANKIPVGWTSTQEYTILAMLALDDRPVNAIAADVAELDKLIKKQRGFGDFSLDRAFRLLYASAISTSTHQDTTKVGTITDNVAIAVAQALVDWFIFVVAVAS